MKIIGISGTNGSGKDTLAEIICAEKNYMFVSVADLLRIEARKRGLPLERKNLRDIGNEWRGQFGPEVLVDKSVELFKESGDKYEGLVVEPMRSLGEGKRVKELGGTLIWVDADSKVRYERIAKRARGADDKKTYDQFIQEEKVELRSQDPAAPSLLDVKKIADKRIQNDGHSIEDFKTEVKQGLVPLL